QCRLAIRRAEECDSRGEIVGCKSRGNRNGGGIYQKRIQDRNAFIVHIRRIDSVFDECRLMFNRFVNDRIELLIRHDFTDLDHEILSGLKILTPPYEVGFLQLVGPLRGFAGWKALGELRRSRNVLASLERRIRIASQVRPQSFIRYSGIVCAFGEQCLEIRNNDRINDSRAGRPQLAKTFLKYGIDFLEVLGIRLRIQSNRFAQHTDPSALETASLERRRVAHWSPAN